MTTVKEHTIIEDMTRYLQRQYTIYRNAKGAESADVEVLYTSMIIYIHGFIRGIRVLFPDSEAPSRIESMLIKENSRLHEESMKLIKKLH
ncbi:hypothetical protein [Ruminococcus sp. HUN007]|uniref:hypothetical protein n=1 Tax=Ruminococcus sp. HUN007 TaxID=1514668 RepID=UPI0005D1CF15|nr:hypothetical protein [Ruminococcus sp. HUN007]